MSEQTETAAVPGPGLAAPGPHPLEADDVRYWRGDETGLPEGVEATGGQPAGEAPADPNLAAPGPHPHEAADLEDYGGRQLGLPPGVKPYKG